MSSAHFEAVLYFSWPKRRTWFAAVVVVQESAPETPTALNVNASQHSREKPPLTLTFEDSWVRSFFELVDIVSS